MSSAWNRVADDSRRLANRCSPAKVDAMSSSSVSNLAAAGGRLKSFSDTFVVSARLVGRVSTLQLFFRIILKG